MNKFFTNSFVHSRWPLILLLPLWHFAVARDGLNSSSELIEGCLEAKKNFANENANGGNTGGVNTTQHSTINAYDEISLKCPLANNATSDESFRETTSTVCLNITGFSDRDFSANGLYCKFGQNATFKNIAIPDALRYELRRINDERWNLLRVVKTKGEIWTGVPIYVGLLPKSDFETKHVANDNLQHFEWLGLTLNHKESRIDNTEPTLRVVETKAPLIYTEALGILSKYRSNEIDICHVSICDGRIVRSAVIDTNWCIEFWTVAAHISEITGNNDETLIRLEKARTCAQKSIYEFADNNIPIPRFKRWQVAELSYLMSHALVKGGRIDDAIVATTTGLASSPEQTQRRLLYANLGDLRLASGNQQGALHAYQLAFHAVREKGGAVESRHFLSYFAKSVGDFISQVTDEDAISILPSDYGIVRSRLLLQINGGGFENEVNTSESASFNKITLGKQCGLPAIVQSNSQTLSYADNIKFCSQYVLKK